MKSSLKATHAIKGNSKEVSQPGERLPEHKEGWRQEPRPCSPMKAATAQKTQVYLPSRSMNAQKSDRITDPDVAKAFKYYAQYPGVMQGSQEGKRAKLWGPRAHFGANISMKIASLSNFKNYQNVDLECTKKLPELSKKPACEYSLSPCSLPVRTLNGLLCFCREERGLISCTAAGECTVLHVGKYFKQGY